MQLPAHVMCNAQSSKSASVAPPSFSQDRGSVAGQVLLIQRRPPTRECCNYTAVCTVGHTSTVLPEQVANMFSEDVFGACGFNQILQPAELRRLLILPPQLAAHWEMASSECRGLARRTRADRDMESAYVSQLRLFRDKRSADSRQLGKEYAKMSITRTPTTETRRTSESMKC